MSTPAHDQTTPTPPVMTDARRLEMVGSFFLYACDHITLLSQPRRATDEDRARARDFVRNTLPRAYALLSDAELQRHAKIEIDVFLGAELKRRGLM